MIDELYFFWFLSLGDALVLNSFALQLEFGEVSLELRKQRGGAVYMEGTSSASTNGLS